MSDYDDDPFNEGKPAPKKEEEVKPDDEAKPTDTDKVKKLWHELDDDFPVSTASTDTEGDKFARKVARGSSGGVFNIGEKKPTPKYDDYGYGGGYYGGDYYGSGSGYGSAYKPKTWGSTFDTGPISNPKSVTLYVKTALRRLIMDELRMVRVRLDDKSRENIETLIGDLTAYMEDYLGDDKSGITLDEDEQGIVEVSVK